MNFATPLRHGRMEIAALLLIYLLAGAGFAQETRGTI